MDDEYSLSVISGRMLDGTYAVVVEVGNDYSARMPPAVATEYALTLVKAAERAEYDEAVFRQLMEVLGRHSDREGDPAMAAAMMVRSLRDARDPLPRDGFALYFEPALGAATKAGFVDVTQPDGRQLGGWALPYCREHATDILRALEVSALDDRYRAALLDMGLEDDRVATVVDDLSRYRP